MRERGRAGGFRRAAGAARAASPAAPRPGRPGPLRALRFRDAPHLLQGSAALTPRKARRRPGSRRVGLARHHGAAAGPGGPARLRDPRPRPCAASAAAAGAAACQAASRRVRAGPSVHRGPRGAGAGLSETELPRAPHRNATRRGPRARRRPARPPPRPGSPRPSARRGASEAAPEQNEEGGRADAVRRATRGTLGQRRCRGALLPLRGLRACRQPVRGGLPMDTQNLRRGRGGPAMTSFGRACWARRTGPWPDKCAVHR